MAYLISEGANPLETTADGTNAVLSACYGGHRETLQWLVEELHCSLDVQDKLRNRPMHCAAVNTKPDAMNYLLDKIPGELNLTNEKGHTPLDIAAYNGAVATIKMLLGRNCITTNIDTRGNTPVHGGVVSDNAECLKLLLYACPPAYLEHVNNEGFTPLKFAKHKKLRNMVRVIKEYEMVQAVLKGDLRQVRRLHEDEDVSLLCTDDKGRTLQQLATAETVKAYLSENLQPDDRSRSSRGGGTFKITGFHIGVLTFMMLASFYARK